MEINCQRVKENLAAYHDGGLTEEMMVVIEKHLEECEECRDDFNGLKETMEDIKTGKLGEPPYEPRGVTEGRDVEMGRESCPSEMDLMLYCDNEIDDLSKREAIEKHLKRCSFCQQDYTEFRRLNQLIKAAALEPPEDLLEKIFESTIKSQS